MIFIHPASLPSIKLLYHLLHYTGLSPIMLVKLIYHQSNFLATSETFFTTTETSLPPPPPPIIIIIITTIHW